MVNCKERAPCPIPGVCFLLGSSFNRPLTPARILSVDSEKSASIPAAQVARQWDPGSLTERAVNSGTSASDLSSNEPRLANSMCLRNQM